MIRILTDELEYYQLINAKNTLVLVDFYADWCAPCKWLDQILTSIDPKIEHLATILKVDIELFPVFQAGLQLQSVPVLILYKNGAIVWRMNGFLAEDELVEKIKSFI